MYLDHKRVFLAGSTGLAGSSIMNYLLAQYPTTKIRACYHTHTKPFIQHERVEYVDGDLRSQEDCRRMAQGCDCAIMAAANTGGASVLASRPWTQVNDNVTMNVQMLEAFHFENVTRVVYIGSATLYQEFEGHIKEHELDLNQDPHPAYLGIGWVVRFVEKLCQFWHKESGMEIMIARSANIFGPHAKFDPATSNFIPAIIRKAVENMDPFEVWGSPDVTRDVIYSADFARAIVMMMETDQIAFDTFNIGSGVKTTVAEVVRWALQYARHFPDKITYLSDKPVTIRCRALDCSKTKEMLGWQPQYTIEEGVKKTTRWWIENKAWWKK